MITVAQLVARVTAETGQFNAGMAAAEGRMASAAGTMGAIGGTLTRRVTLPLVVVGAAGVKMSLDFDHSMNLIRSLVGASSQQMDEYRKGVLKLATETPQGPKALADALYFVTSSGFKGAQALSILDASAKAAAAGLGDTATVADAVTSAVNAYGIKSLSAAKATDVLLATVREGKTEPAELAGAIGRVIAPAQAMGVTFGQVGGAVAGLSLEGLNAAESVTGLRGILMGLLKPTKQTREFLDATGNSIGKLRTEVANKGLLPTLQRLRREYGDNKDALGQLFPNVRALNAFLALTGKNAAKNAAVMRKVVSASGDTNKAFATMSKDGMTKLKVAWSSVQVALIGIGGILAPIVEKVAGFVAMFIARFQTLPGPIKTAFGIVAIAAAALGPVLMIVGAALTALTSPIGLIIIAAAALGAGLYLLYQRSATVRDIVSTFASVFSGAVSPVQGLTTVLTKLGFSGAQASNIARTLVGAWNSARQSLATAWTAISTYATQTWNQISKAVSQHSAEIRATITSALNTIRAIWTTVWPYLSRIVQIAWELIKNMITTNLKIIGNLIGAVMAIIRGDWGQAWAYLKAAAIAALQGAATSVKIILTQLVPAVASLALHVGLALVTAILSGLAKLGVALMGKLEAGVSDAISAVIGYARMLALDIGKAIVGGIVSGVAGLAGQLAGAVKGAVGGALHSVRSHFGIGSPSKVFAAEVGKPIADGIILGFLLGIRDLPPKIADSVRNALEAARTQVEARQSRLADAFRRLADYALRAFDGQTQAHLKKMQAAFDVQMQGITNTFAKKMDALKKVYDQKFAALDKARSAALDKLAGARDALTPAEAMLQQMQDSHAQEQLQKALSDAQQQLTAAMQTGDPQAIKDAQQAIANAQYDLTVASLQKQAEVERAAANKLYDQKAQEVNDQFDLLKQQLQDEYDAKVAALQAEEEAAKKAAQDAYDRSVLNYQSLRDLQRQHLEDMLNEMGDALQKHPERWAAYHKKIMKKFAEAFKESGQNLGIGFEQGLRESFGDVKKAVKDLAQLIANILKLHSPAEEGPLSDLDTWWRPFGTMLAAQIDGGPVKAKLASLLGLPAAAGGGGAIGGTGGCGSCGEPTVIHLSGNTFLTGDRAAARELAERLEPFLNAHRSVSRSGGLATVIHSTAPRMGNN